MKKVLLRIALVLVGPLVLVGTLDVVITLWGFEYPPELSPILLPLPEGKVDGRLLHARDPLQLWKPIPGATVPWGRDTINSDGFRGPGLAREKVPGIVRIAALGDSSTFGHSVEWNECWAALLPSLLAERGVQAESINAGVIGSTACMGVERYKASVRPFRPDVVVAAYGAVNEHVPAFLMPDVQLIEKLAFDQDPLAVELQRLRRDLRLLHLLDYWSDALHGGREELRKERHRREIWKSHHADEAGAVDWPGDRRASVAEFSEALRTLKRLVEEDGGVLVLLAMPRRPSVYRILPVVEKYTEATLAVAVAESLTVVDGKLICADAIGAGATIPDFFVDNYHPTALGHEWFAKALAVEIARVASAR